MMDAFRPAEFFGLTNLELVRAQQYLGKLNDLDRTRNLLLRDGELDALIKLKAEYQGIRRQFNAIRKNLPYGLRPYMKSTAIK